MSHVDRLSYTPEKAAFDTPKTTSDLPQIIPDIDTIDFWANSPEESLLLKDRVQREIFSKSAVFDVLQIRQALTALNDLGHAGKGSIVERSDLMPYTVPIRGTNDWTCESVGVTHSLSLFYKAGINEHGREAFGRFAFVIKDYGEFGFSFSSSERPTHDSSVDTFTMTDGPGFRPIATLGALQSRITSGVPHLPIIVGGEITPSASLLFRRLTDLTRDALVKRKQVWRKAA